MSEPLRDLAASDEKNKVAPNYFGFYTREVAELLSEDVDFKPFSFQNPELSVEVRETNMSKHRNTGESEMANSFTSAGSSFSNGIGAGLSEFKKERLKGLLRQSVNILTQEVDEMLDPVVATRRLLFHLRDRKHPLSYSDATSDGDAGNLSCKKLKILASSCSSGVSVATVAEIEASHAVKKSCSRCHTSKTSMWRTGPEGSKLCNACGIKLKKDMGSMLTKNKERESLLGSHVGNDEGNEEVSDDLKFLLEIDRSQVEQTMKKYSGELCETLEHMEQQLEKLLDTVMAKCRPMSLFEKQQLQNMIQYLPPDNLDRVVEIIRHGKQSHNDKEFFVDLEEEDNSTLWRLYYYAEAVVNARKLST